MSKLKIVSSYSDSCGNAYFTKVLESGLQSLGHECSCAELNLELTQSLDSGARKKADRHIQDLCEVIAAADGCNIQMEAGLFGTYPSDIVARVKKLASANKNVSVTLHSPRLLGDSASQRDAIKSIFSGRIKSGLAQFLNYKKNNIHFDINRKIIKFLTERNIPLIVHTNRAKRQIFNIYGYDNVSVHPLKFVDAGRLVDRAKLKILKDRYKLGEGDVIIGMFGFINDYKGHSLALKALKELPPNFKLFIFGRVHPQTIKNGAVVDPYLNHLHDNISHLKINNRVFFIGETGTEDFIDYAATVNFVWLPYAEVGQDGSGIASICFDVSSSVCASTSFAFDELLYLIPYSNVQRFDIGNHMELAQKTRFPPVFLSDFAEAANSVYTTKTQSQMYSEVLAFPESIN